MAELILHHYDEAPFAEKIRFVFGVKNLTWRSVVQPSAMPKPDLMPLQSVTIRRDDPRVGEVCVHFPKIGYLVEPA